MVCMWRAERRDLNDHHKFPLGHLLFLIYINDLSDNISSIIRLFADDCIIYLGLFSPKSPEQPQSDLDSLFSCMGR